MPIDGCSSTFEELATGPLRGYMDQMRQAIAHSIPMSSFCSNGAGIKTILTTLRRNADFSGCYVLLNESGPFYVGISRGVIQRLRQHVNGTTHFDASLAYRMACRKVEHNFTRAKAMEHPPFQDAFKESKLFLQRSSVAFVEIQNPLELYLFEAYCAMALDTGEWNTFETH